MNPETELSDIDIDDLRPEYDFDFSEVERGRYSVRIKSEGSIVNPKGEGPSLVTLIRTEESE
jgi:hypothetical protein